MIRLLMRIRQASYAASIMITAIATPAVAQQNDDGEHEVMTQTLLDLQYADEHRCFIISGDEVRPVLPLLVSTDDLPGVEHELVIVALDDALARGCDIHQPDLIGLSPLNTAILQGSTALVQYLLEHGADPDRIIDSSQSELDGRNSIEFIELLRERNPQREEIWSKLYGMMMRYHDVKVKDPE